jgi:predicted  nucleic acid-binding Zn-ribbon protein
MKTTCLHCDKEYETKRDSSLYCSNSCRTGAYKLRKKNEQIKAARQKAAAAQKEKDNQKKREDEELRKQESEKRREAKEEKALKPTQKNDQETLAQQNSVELEPNVKTEEDLTQPDKFVTKEDPPKIPRRSKHRKQYSTKEDTKINFWKGVRELIKYYDDKK